MNRLGPGARSSPRDLASRRQLLFVIGLLCQAPAALWWTNGFIEADRDFLESGGRPPGFWNPLTDAFFDSGVIGIDPTSLAIAWVTDED